MNMIKWLPFKTLITFLLILSGQAALCLTANAETKKSTSPVIREVVYKHLASAQTSHTNNQTQKAFETLAKLNAAKTLNGHERAMMWNQYGAIYYDLNQFNNSIDSYENLLKESGFPLALRRQTLYTLAQLYFTVNKYKTTIDRLQTLFSLSDKPSETAYALQAQAYYKLNNHQKVVDSMNKALSVIDDKNAIPNEQWMVLLQSSLTELGLEQKRVDILKWLVRLFPKKDYMISLAGAYGEMEQSAEQLAIMELAYKKGFLNEERLQLALATLFFIQGSPYKGAKVIQQGLSENLIKKSVSNYTLLANCLRAAQEFEKALSPLTSASQLANDGDIYFTLGSVYFKLGRWQETIDTLTKGLTLEPFNNAGHAWMLLGQAHLNLQAFDLAIDNFTKAKTYADIEKLSDRWIRYANNEKERYEVFNK